MRKSLFILMLLFTGMMNAQKNFFGIDACFLSKPTLVHDVINIDTNYYNGNYFYIKNLKGKSTIEIPSVYVEHKTRKGFFLGLKGQYNSRKYTLFDGSALYDFAYTDYYLQRYFSLRAYAGKEFLINKKCRPFFYVGINAQYNTLHRFESKSSATLKYNFTNYENWLNQNYKLNYHLSAGAGIKEGIFGFYVFMDKSLMPLNLYMKSYSLTGYLSVRADIVGKTTGKIIPVIKTELGTVVTQKAYVVPGVMGVSVSHPFTGGFEFAKDTITGVNYDSLTNIKDLYFYTDGYIFDGFLSVEIRKRAELKFSPQISLYSENTISKNQRWYLRHSISYRRFSQVYKKAAKNYDGGYYLFINSDPGNPDVAFNEVSIKNEYNLITNEHSVGFRFLTKNKPNYFVLNAGLRLNWRLKHWNIFTPKARFVVPTVCTALLYKANRFSYGISAERTFYAPDKKKYYKSFFSVCAQLNFDIYKWKR